MPENRMPHPTDPRPAESGCPFKDWCREPHMDDWMNGDDGSPMRFHTAQLTPACEFPFIAVEETRTIDGVWFSIARVCVSDSLEMSMERFADELAEQLNQLPAWRSITRDVDDLRETLSGVSLSGSENAS